MISRVSPGRSRVKDSFIAVNKAVYDNNIIIKRHFVFVANGLSIGWPKLDKWHLAKTIGSLRLYGYVAA